MPEIDNWTGFPDRPGYYWVRSLKESVVEARPVFIDSNKRGQYVGSTWFASEYYFVGILAKFQPIKGPIP